MSVLADAKLRGSSLVWQQMKTLLIKQILLTKGIIWLLLLNIVIVLVLTALVTGGLGILVQKAQMDTSAFELKLEEYGKTTVIYGNNRNEYVQDYVETVKISGSEPKEAQNVTGSLLSVAMHNLDTYHEKYIVAADFNNNITALYSNVAYHSLPISLNLITNSILRPKGGTVVVKSHPLNTPKEVTSIVNILRGVGFIIIGCILSYSTSTFIMMPHAERINKAKLLQYMSGVSPTVYWLSYFLWDFSLYLVIVVFMLIIVLIFVKMSYFSGVNEIGVLMLVFALYGWSAIPTAYLFSYCGKTEETSVSVYITINLLFGAVLPLVIYLLDISPDAQARVAVYVLDLSPHFALTYALLRFSDQAFENNHCKFVSCKESNVGFCCQAFKKDPARYIKPYLAFPNKENPNGMMIEVLYLAVDVFLYVLLLALLDYNILKIAFQILLRMRFGTDVQTKQELDEDVAEEQQYVLEKFEGTNSTLSDREDILMVDNLVKKYRGRFAAVKGISFGVMKGECFGLLGSNGAGKTTVFKMLTGDEIPTRGDAAIDNYTLRKHKRKFLRQAAYCPQSDALNEVLTGREILQLYAGLRGLPKNIARQEVKKWITLLGLQQYEKQQSSTYSGGNKRKLSTAVALIANSPIVFLDEPTSGIDAVSRRNLWNILDKKQTSGQSIVLTSHSMDECEALCNRLAIMVAGELVCIGPIPHLKQKFAQGFTIQINLNVTDDYENQVMELKNNFEQHALFVGNCTLGDENLVLLSYNVTNPDILWSQLFKAMEDLKNIHSIIKDYIVTETTLEQVFLYFAKQETQQEI